MYPWLEATASAQHKALQVSEKSPVTSNRFLVWTLLYLSVSAAPSSSIELGYNSHPLFLKEHQKEQVKCSRSWFQKDVYLGTYISFDMYASPTILHLIRTEAITLF